MKSRGLSEVINTRIPAGMTNRLQAVLGPKETQGAVIRDLIVEMVLERERRMGTDD